MLKVNWTNPQGKTFSYYPASDVEARDARIRQILKEIRASTGSVGKKTLIDEALALLLV